MPRLFPPHIIQLNIRMPLYYSYILIEGILPGVVILAEHDWFEYVVPNGRRQTFLTALAIKCGLA